MKKTLQASFAFSLVGLLTGSAYASESIVGNWHGKLRFDMANLRPLKNPRSNAARMAELNHYQQMTISLTVKGDHTYVLRTMGGKQMPQITGTWTATPGSISLQQLDHGRPAGAPVVYFFDKTMKSFSVTKNGGGVISTLTFFR